MNPAELPIFGIEALRAAITEGDAVDVVREALVRHARGEVTSPPPGQLLFDRPPGDCHIKFGHFDRGRYFVVKVATGFYDNPKRGLPTNGGLVLVFSAETGQTIALLRDEGWLTTWRTAAAGALAARAGAPREITRIGIIGAGHQAQHQALWTARLLGVPRVSIWGRAESKASSLAEQLCRAGLEARAESTAEELLRRANLVITCTQSSTAIVQANAVERGTHIVAVGADSPGKQELDPELFARAAVIMTDDHEQCLHHGDFHYAVRDGFVDERVDVPLGSVLSGETMGRKSEDDITIADLTGIAAEDVAIASLAVERLLVLAGPCRAEA